MAIPSEWVATFFSGLGAIAATWQAYQSRQSAHDAKMHSDKANLIQANMLDIASRAEAQKDKQSKSARLIARLKDQSRGFFLIIQNTGEAEARKITVKIDGHSLSEHKSVANRGTEEVPTIKAGTDWTCCFLHKTLDVKTRTVFLSWEDDVGRHSQEYPVEF